MMSSADILFICIVENLVMVNPASTFEKVGGSIKSGSYLINVLVYDGKIEAAPLLFFMEEVFR